MNDIRLQIGEVGEITGIRLPTLHRWLDRRVFMPSPAEIGEGSGNYRTFGRARLNQIAIAKALIEIGLPAAQSNANARLFTEQSQRGRQANELFEAARTLLVISKTGTAIVPAPFDALLTDVCDKDGAFVIDIGPIIADADQKLSQLKSRKN